MTEDRAPTRHHARPGLAVTPLYPPTRILRRDLFASEYLLAEATRIRAAAATWAQEHTAAAQQASERLRTDAEAEARRAVEAAAAAARRDTQAQFTRLLDDMAAGARAFDAALATQAATLAWQLARTVLEVEFALHPGRIVNMVQRVLERARLATSLVVRVRPTDLELVRAQLPELERSVGARVNLAPDPELPLGGVRVETGRGTYDGTIEAWLLRFRQRIQARAARRS